MSRLPDSYTRFRREHPKVWEAYASLGEAASEEEPLEGKVRELIKLGMAAGAHSVSAVQSHVHRALAEGASPEEIEHAIILGVTTLGYPTMMAALTWAREAIEDAAGGET